MTEQEAQKEIIRLTKLINHHNELYWNKSASDISDYEYDQLLATLIQLEDTFPHLKKKKSPTQRINGVFSKNFKKTYHQYPMLSLSNTYSLEEVIQFVQRIHKGLLHEDLVFFCELKFDGVAISLVYHEGILVRVVTRGDGEKGDDITQNALQIQHLPKKVLNATSVKQFEVRGEAFMSRKQLEKINTMRAAQGQILLANPRNATAGTLKVLDPAIVVKRAIDCYVYEFQSDDIQYKTHEDGIHVLERWGFNVSPTYKKCFSIQEVVDYIYYWKEHQNDLEVAIDGIVIKVNDLNQQKQLGTTTKSPRWAIAYKYAPEQLASTLDKVVFQVGRTGVITPVAHFMPIYLGGTVVKRASLHNVNEIVRKQLRKGDRIFVEKRGEIIPKVVGIDLSQRKKNSVPVVFPTHCPACNTLLIRKDDEVAYYCPNTKECIPQLQGNIAHFVQRKAMSMNIVGPKTIAILFQHGLISTPVDLYRLHYEDVYSLHGFSTISTYKLLHNIQQSKKMPFDRVLYALGIRHVGAEVAKKLVKHFKKITALIAASKDDFMTIPNIGEQIAYSVIAYFQDTTNMALVDALQKEGLQFSLETEELISKEGSLQGKKIVISGIFRKFDRETLQKIIEKNGGKVLQTPSSHVDYLVAGTKAGPMKLKQANMLQIPILSEEALMKMIAL